MKKTVYVDPMIGTVGDEQDTSFHGGGKTHPGATYPFGMVQLSPVINIVENGGVKDNMLTIFSILAEALAYVDFIIYAKALNKAEN